MNQRHQRRVIGYFASDGAHLLLDNHACVVTGSEATLQALIEARPSLDGFGNPLVMQGRKIRFAAIMQGLEGGGSYAFDEQAYSLFYPLANLYGYTLGDEPFNQPGESGVALLVISQLICQQAGKVSPQPIQR